MAFYVLDENKNLVASFDREGFLAILQQAIATGSLENIDEDSAVASKLRSNINGTAHYIEFVTAAQYSELEAQGALVLGTYYFITDDTTEEDLETAISSLMDRTDSLETRAGNLEDRAGDLEDRADSLETDVGVLQNDVSDIQDIFAFSGGLNGFTILKNVYNGNVLNDSGLPSAGLYILHIQDRSNQGSNDYSSVLIYWDGQHYSRSSVFSYEYYAWGISTPTYAHEPAKVRITSEGKALLCSSNSENESSSYQYFQINYRKIG